jgi:hypothetical protein
MAYILSHGDKKNLSANKWSDRIASTFGHEHLVARREKKSQTDPLEFIMVVIITLDPTENVISNMFIKNLKLIILVAYSPPNYHFKLILKNKNKNTTSNYIDFHYVRNKIYYGSLKYTTIRRSIYIISLRRITAHYVEDNYPLQIRSLSNSKLLHLIYFQKNEMI